MRTTKKIARNSTIFVGGNLTFRLLSFIIIVYLARYLGVSEFGKYNIVFAYVAIFNVISDLGLQTILVRDIARNEKNISKLIGNAFILRVFLTLIAIASAIVFIDFMSYPDDIRLYTYIASFQIFYLSFNDFYATVFQANLRVEYSVIAKISSRIISGLLIFWIILNKGTLAQVIISVVLSETVKLLITLYFSRKFISPVFEFDPKILKYLITAAFPLALLGLINVSGPNLGLIILSKLSTEESVGLFSAAQRILRPLSLLPLAMSVSIFPVMSTFHKSNSEKLEKTLILSVKYMVIGVLPIAVGVTILSQSFINIIYGKQFLESSLVLKILIWGFLLTAVNSIFYHSMISINQQNFVTISSITGTILGLIVAIILIPRYDYLGLAFSSLTGRLSVFILNFYFLTKTMGSVPFHRLLPKPIISVVMMGGLIYLLGFLNIFILIPFGAMTYFASLYFLKAFSAEEIKRLKSIVPAW
jgi:O-antigen/teichoic acid export membrane protein